MGEFSKFQAKIRDVGGIPIKRLLPNIGKKTIGAWCFLDHAGPREFKPNEKTMQVAHHPHSFLQTFTWMLEGEILHKDILGNEMVIKKNQVNLMTAGHGISHTEQMLLGENKFHALQLWIALPKETGDSIPPSFYNYPDIPCWIDDKDKSEYRLPMGTYAGYQAPTLQYSPIVAVHIITQDVKTLALDLNPEFEYGIMVIKGNIFISEKETLTSDELGYIPLGKSSLEINIEQGTELFLIGGTPLNYQPTMWWNFVGPDEKYIEKATDEWNHGTRFGDIETELGRLNAPQVPWKKTKD